MNKTTNGMSNYFENVPDQVRKARVLVWLFFIVATAIAFMGMEHVKFDMTIEGWFADDDPTIVALDGFHQEFGSDDHAFVIYKPKDGDVFSTQSLKIVQQIRYDLLALKNASVEGEPLDRIVRITTLDNAPILRTEQDTLITKHLVGPDIPTDQAALDQIRAMAETQATFPLLYFSKDYTYGGIFIETNFGAIPVDSDDDQQNLVLEEDLTMDDMSMEAGDYEQERMRFKPTDLSEYLSFMNAIKEVLNKPEYSAHFEYHPVGNPAATEYDMKMLEEMGSLYMGMIMIIIVMLWFLCRSVSGVLWPLTIVILSCIWTVGLTGWLGFTVTGHLVLTVVMVLVVGIADAIHIISGYIFFRKEGHDHQSALRQSYGKSGKAILLTTVTTMIAMLVLTITPIAPIKVFGFMTAAGIGLAFIFSIYLLPLLLDLWSVMKKDPSKSNVLSRLLKTLGKVVPDFAALTQRGLVKVLPIVERRKTAIVYGSFAVFALCMYGATQVKVDTDPIAQYPQDSKIRTSFEIADTKMVGTQVMEIYLDMGEEYAFHDPKVLKAIEQLQIKLETDYSQWVVRTSSLVGVVKDSYQTLNENRKEMYIIPDDPRVLSQTLFMFNNSNPVDRRKMVSDDYRRSHISVYLYNGGSYEYTQVFEQMRADIELTLKSLEATYPDSKVSITGMFTLLMQGSDYLSWSSLTSFGLVVVIITVILLLVFGSFKAGLISVVPNLVPATLTFGVMGLLDIPMDFTTVMIAPIIIGIAVDDTIHFLNHYRSEVLIDGDIRRALSQTIHEVGQAVMFTSLILGLGLSVLSVSSSVGNANVGMFGSAAVFTALLCDLFLLPALILMFKLDFAGSKQAVQKPQATAQVSS